VHTIFSGQWKLPDAISGGAKTGAAQSIGVQQHVLFPVEEERKRERKQEKEPTLTIGTTYMHAKSIKFYVC
jgi:hypothetical protein